MPDADVMYKQAVAAYKAGRKDEARTLLLEIVGEHEHHEQSWLLLSGLVDTLDEQQICLENVVALNPANDRARKGLETVNQKIAARDKQAPPPASPIGTEFAASPDNDIFANSPWAAPAQQPPDFGVPNSSFDDWLPFNNDAPPPPDPFGAPTSSVDWGRSDGPAAYGSGKQVELPSNQEYDDWVQGLNLGGSPPAAPDNLPFQAETPFGDTSFMIEPDANSFMASPPPSSPPVDPFGRNELFANEPNPWNVDSTPFADEPDTVFPNSSTPFSSPESPPVVPAFEGFDENDFAGNGPFVMEESPDKGIARFDFDAKDEDDDDLWPDPNTIAPQPPSVPVFASKQGPVNVQAEAYFRYIPDEIEPKVGGIERRSLFMLAGIAGLVILNLVSFGALLM